MTPTFGLMLMIALTGQHVPIYQLRAAPAFSEDAAVRLAYMKDSVTPYRIHRAAAESPLFRLRPDPIFRLTIPQTKVRDSVIWLWTDEATGRPEATIQMFRDPRGIWIQDWTSLSASPIVAEDRSGVLWRPRPGVQFHPVPGAPKPATSPQSRLRQLHALSEQFSASDYFMGESWTVLRLLPKPWLRYGKAGSEVEDGAMFAFVLGTDPEAMLMIEARPDPSGDLRWEYAWAPMSSFELKASWKGDQVWTLPWRKRSDDPTDPFFDMPYSVEPQ